MLDLVGILELVIVTLPLSVIVTHKPPLTVVSSYAAILFECNHYNIQVAHCATQRAATSGERCRRARRLRLASDVLRLAVSVLKSLHVTE